MVAVMLARLVLQHAPKRLTVFCGRSSVCGFCSGVDRRARLARAETGKRSSNAVEHISGIRRAFQSVVVDGAPNVSSGTDRALTARQWGNLAFELLPYLWVIGAAALFLAQLLKLYRLRKKLRDAVEISPGVYVSDKLSGAFVLGLFRPDIYLPEGLGERTAAVRSAARTDAH